MWFLGDQGFMHPRHKRDAAFVLTLAITFCVFTAASAQAQRLQFVTHSCGRNLAEKRWDESHSELVPTHAAASRCAGISGICRSPSRVSRSRRRALHSITGMSRTVTAPVSGGAIGLLPLRGAYLSAVTRSI